MKPKSAPPGELTAASRRQFLKNSSLAVSGLAMASSFPFARTTHAAPDDPIRIGVVGCGGRGTGAAVDALGAATTVIYPQSGYHTEDVAHGAKATARNVKIAALADVFPDRLYRCREQLHKLGTEIPEEHCFSGFDAYERLLAIEDVNYVILATPPHFRPAQLLATIKAGKHAFVEKPVAVDPAGIRLVFEAADLAREKGLGIAAGTQRRHQRSYQETVRRLQDGAVGEILSCRAYWNGGVIWVVEREPSWSDMEWQLRNWNYFTWLSGDHVVEQHVHNLDVINWVLQSHPIRAIGLGGRQARPGPLYGHIYDHFAVEYEYPNGVRMFSQCRQMSGCDGKVEEAVVGTLGDSNCRNFIRTRGDSRTMWRFREEEPNPYQQEHIDLIRSIRAGQPINEGHAVAESTFTAILGRESTYSGRTLEWDELLGSDQKLGPEKYQFGELPFPDVPIPGQYKIS